MFRINTYLKDRSNAIAPSASILSSFVVETIKGRNTPVLIEKGETQRILDLYGYPNSSYPDVQDAIDYNNKGALYLVAPYSNGKYSGVFVTQSGTEAIVSGLEDISSINFALVPVIEPVGLGDGVETNFTLVIDTPTRYVNQSIDILVDGVSITVTATDAEPEVLSTAPDVGSGTFTRASGTLDFTFTTAPTSGVVITASYNANYSTDTYFALFSTSHQADDMGTKITSLENGTFNIQLYRKDIDSDFQELNNSPYEGSIVANTKNGSGRNIYLDILFKDSDDVISVVNTSLSFTTFVDDIAMIEFAGGDRGDSIVESDIATAYDLFNDRNTYPVSIIFSSHSGQTIATKFETLRTTYHTRTRFLMPAEDDTLSGLLSDVDTTRYNLSDRGIRVFVGTWGIHTDLYNDADFVCSNMGLIAGKHYDNLNLSFGGKSCMWIDEDGVGGQLGSSITKLNIEITDTAEQTFNNAGLNPIVKDPTYGVMIRADKTTQITPFNDYSYCMHSGLADYILNQIETNVLPFQIGKLNDDNHQSSVKMSSESILASVTELLNDFYVKCDRENNNSAILDARKFVLTVGVQFTTNSQFIDFIFINGPQGLDIQEVVNKTIR